jgi:hypothetical protein
MISNKVGTAILKAAFLPRAIASLALAIELLFAIEARASDIWTNPGFETGNLSNWLTFQSHNSVGSSSPAHGGTC